LREGKNRQIRKMTAAIGFPTLRLIRVGLLNLSIDNVSVGTIREISRKEI
jgi:23S rRNA pseudouridine2457 synthase